MDINTFNASVKAYLGKINFGTLCAALLVFFLPWTSVQCSGREFATQSGFQAIYGGASLSDEMEDMRSESAESGDDAGDIGIGLIAFLTFMLVLAGTLVSGLALFNKIELPLRPGVLAAAALLLLLFQTIIGFPIDRSVQDAREESRAEEDSMARAMDAAVAINSERLGWFYVELLLLAVPAGLYIAGRAPMWTARTGDGKPVSAEPVVASPLAVGAAPTPVVPAAPVPADPDRPIAGP